MNIITISREFGSGGRELGKRLADLTGYDYYDSEILSAVAKNSGKDARYVETALAELPDHVPRHAELPGLHPVVQYPSAS